MPAAVFFPIDPEKSPFDLIDVVMDLVKHRIGAKHYVRYVDDFVLLHESPQWLNDAQDQIEDMLDKVLAARPNAKKTILQPIDTGIDFVGQVIKPWRRITRRKTANSALSRIHAIDPDELFETANSYFGLFRQSDASHHDRARLANVLRKRGHCIKTDLTKTYRRSA